MTSDSRAMKIREIKIYSARYLMREGGEGEGEGGTVLRVESGGRGVGGRGFQIREKLHFSNFGQNTPSLRFQTLSLSRKFFFLFFFFPKVTN